MRRHLRGWAAILLGLGAAAPGAAQLPVACKPPAAAVNAPAGTPKAEVDDAVGVWFAQRGKLDCSVAAFQEAIRLQPDSAEAHFDLGLARERQGEEAAAAGEFRLALRYDPELLPARCALGSAISDPAEATREFQKALDANPQLVCALDGLAQVLAGQGQYDAAAHDWRKALRVQPNAPDLELSLATAVYKSAVARETAGQPPVAGATVQDAVQILTNLLRRHPGLTAAHFTLGSIYANEKQFRRAAAEYGAVVHDQPSDAVALGAEVKALVNAAEYSEALVPARDYVKRKPDDPAGHVLLGTVYLELGDNAEAKPELERGEAMAPDNFEARYELGLVLARMEKPAEALPQLREALALEPANRPAQVELLAVLRTLGQTQQALQIAEQLKKETGQDSLNSRLAAEGNQANRLLEAGKPEEAAQIYRQMLSENPGSAATAYNLALALEATGDAKGAEGVLRKAISMDPKQGRICAELGRLELAEGDVAGAQKWLQSAVDLMPGLVGARGNLAIVYARKGDLISAEKLLRQAVEEDPKYTEGYLNLGLILAQQNRKSDAERELGKAVELAPKDPATLSTAGEAELRMGKTTQGIALLQKVVELEPDLAAGHLNLAMALSHGYNLGGALAQVSDAVRLAPQSGVAHFYRGQILYDLGRSAEAREEFENASRLDPQMAKPEYFLALLAKQEGKYPLAISLLEKAVKLQPGDVMPWYMLGQCQQQESETAKAVEAWRKAIAIDPTFSQALFSLARALRSTNPAEAKQLMDRYIGVQKKLRILDRADMLANNGVEAASAHDWPEAVRQLKGAIAACGDCAAKASLYRKLGIIDCEAGNLKSGERELLTAKSLNPSDPITQAALELAARARRQQSTGAGGAANRERGSANP